VHTNKTNATTAPTTASPTSVTDTDSVVAIPRDGQQVVIQRRAESCMVSRASKTRPLIDHPQKWSSRLLYAAISAAPETVGVPAL